MSKPKALVLGFFTLLPIAYAVFFISLFSRIFFSIAHSSDGPNFSMRMFYIIFPFHVFTMILILILLILYIKDVFTNEFIEPDNRVLWAIVLFFGNMFAMLIYWYIKIWKPLLKKSKTGNQI